MSACQTKSRVFALNGTGLLMYRKIVFLALLCMAEPALASDDPFDVEKEVGPRIEAKVCTAELPDKPLSLSEVIDAALCNNPLTRQSYLSAMAAASQYGEAKSTYLPTIGLSAGINHSNTNYHRNEDTNSAGADASVSLDWLLFDFGARSASVEMMKQALNYALSSRSDVLKTLVFDVTKAYYTLLAAQQGFENSKATVASAKSAYEAASKRYELGLAAYSDALQAKTAYAQAQLSEAQAEEALILAQGKLAVLLNFPPQKGLDLLPVAYSDAQEEEDGKVEDMLQIALEKRSDVMAKRAELKQALANVEYEKKQNAPSFSVSAGVTAGDDLKDRGDRNLNTQIGLSMTVPLFTGFKNTYRITQSRYLADKTAEELKNLENEVQTDVWDAFQSYKTAQKSYKISLVLYASAEQNEKVAMGAYKAGKGSILNVLDAQSKLADARTSKSNTFYEKLIAKSNLIRSMGLINPFEAQKEL